MKLLFSDVEVGGQRLDVAVDNGLVGEIGQLRHDQFDHVIDGRGGALIPGLHDHHLHLLAMAAARTSVDVSRGLHVLRASTGSWVRGVNAKESVDRHALDAIIRDRPVRVQHRGGALWMLNSMALSEVAHVLDQSPDVERDEHGEPTGRLWRYDAKLRTGLDPTYLDLEGVVSDLHRYGITSVTDATPDLDPHAVRILDSLPLPVTLLGDPGGKAPRKLLLRDHDLPSYDNLCSTISEVHAVGRAVAVHCVTRESLVLTLAALEEVGRHPGDRIEHAAVVPNPTALYGLTVVTQPAFVSCRGEDYVREVSPHDLPHLYPYASLLAAGVTVLPSSDAPFGPLDPWQVMRSARDRDLVPSERVDAATVLAGYGSGDIEVGSVARLCLLHVPLAIALQDPDHNVVRETFDFA